MTAIKRIIDTQEPARTGSLGEELKRQLQQRETERAARTDSARLEHVEVPRNKTCKIIVERSKNRIEVFAHYGTMIAYGTVATFSEMQDFIVNFEKSHPLTSIDFRS